MHRRDVHADQSRRHRHRRFGAALDGRARARSSPTGAIGYPPGFAHAPTTQSLQLLGVSKSDDDDEHLRSPRHPRRAVGRVSCAASTNCCRRQRRFTRRSSPSLGLARRSPRAVATAREPRAGRARRGRAAEPSDEMLRGGRRRHGDRLRVSHATAISPRISIRSAPQPPGDPSLDPQTYGLTPALMSAIPGLPCCASRFPATRWPRCCRSCARRYSSTIAYEIEHISNAKQRELAARVHRRRDAPHRALAAAQSASARAPHARSRRWSATCARRSSARRPSRSKAST